jgi:hypothetical protein
MGPSDRDMRERSIKRDKLQPHPVRGPLPAAARYPRRMTSSEEPDKRPRQYQQAAAAGAGAAVGAIIGGPPGAIVGATLGPLLEPFVQKVWAEVTADGRRRGAETLAYACGASDRTIEQILELIDTSDGTRLLAGIAMSAAARTAWEGKVHTLGRSLASGLLAEDDAHIDTEHLIIAAIADIEGPHLSLLDLLVGYEPKRAMGVGVTAIPALHPARRIWTGDEIGAARRLLRPVVPSLLGTLQRHGLAVQNDNTAQALENYGKEFDRRQGRRVPQATPRISGKSVVPPASWSPTDLGDQVLTRFLDAGAEVPDGWVSSPTD